MNLDASEPRQDGGDRASDWSVCEQQIFNVIRMALVKVSGWTGQEKPGATTGIDPDHDLIPEYGLNWIAAGSAFWALSCQPVGSVRSAKNPSTNSTHSAVEAARRRLAC